MTTKTATMTPEAIVRALRSPNPEDRNRGMEALFPDGEGALLIRCTEESTEVASTPKVNGGRLFVALLQTAQNIGAQLGMALQWVRQEPKRPGIQIARPEMLQ